MRLHFLLRFMDPTIFFFHDTPTTEIYTYLHTLSLHDARPISKRLASKTQVARLLYEYGYSLAEIQKLLRLVDWMMRLPRALDALFIQEVDKIRLEKKMAFVTSFERVAKQKGLAQGLEKGLEKGLKQGELKGLRAGKIEGESGLLLRLLARKFGPVPKATKERIQSATSAQLETWSLNILDAEILDEVFLGGHQE